MFFFVDQVKIQPNKNYIIIIIIIIIIIVLACLYYYYTHVLYIYDKRIENIPYHV